MCSLVNSLEQIHKGKAALQERGPCYFLSVPLFETCESEEFDVYNSRKRSKHPLKTKKLEKRQIFADREMPEIWCTSLKVRRCGNPKIQLNNCRGLGECVCGWRADSADGTRYGRWLNGQSTTDLFRSIIRRTGHSSSLRAHCDSSRLAFHVHRVLITLFLRSRSFPHNKQPSQYAEH